MASKDEKKEPNPPKSNAKPYGRVLLTLKNQLLPEDKLTITPSQNDGLSLDAETDLRIYGCELIQTAGILLKLPQVAMATGQVLLQRFYYTKSLVRHPVEHTAMACVCLASKIEEAPRRARDIINVFTHIRQVNSGEGLPKKYSWVCQKHPVSQQNAETPSEGIGSLIKLEHDLRSMEKWIIKLYKVIVHNIKMNLFYKYETAKRGEVYSLERFVMWVLVRTSPIHPVVLDQNYIHLKNLVIKAERRVLKELGFCVHIKHPHKIIVMYLQVLNFQNNQKLMQYSWNYMNDSLRTDVFVRYQPETVACACIYLTARKLKLPLPKNPHWFTFFGATEKEIRDICIRILKLYSRPKPNIDDLEKQVEDLCEKYKNQRAKAKGISGNNSPNNNSQDPQKTSAHNAWGGFISRSGSHMPPPVNDKRSRSRSQTRSPDRRHASKKAKKYRADRSRTRSPKNHKKNHKRKSYSRSRSDSPRKSRKTRDRKRSRSYSNDRDSKNDRYIDRYDDRNDKDKKYSTKDKYKEDRDRDGRHEDRRDSKKYEREREEKNKEDKYAREDKYSSKDDSKEKYASKEEKHKKSKHRERSKSRSKDKRRRS